MALAGLVFLFGRRFRPRERFEWASTDIHAAFMFLGLLGLQNALCLTNASLWAPHMVPWVVLLVGAWVAGPSKGVRQRFFGRWRTRGMIATVSTVLMVVLWASTALPRFLDTPKRIAERQGRLDYSRESYQVSVSDGLALIRAHVLENRRIGTLAYANPFPPLLKSTPPKYVPLWWSVHDSLNMNTPPLAEKVGSDVEVLMEPKWHLDEHGRTQALKLKQEYAGYVASHFSVVAEDRYWIVWLRNAGESQMNSSP